MMDLRACYDLFQLCSDSCLLSSALVLQYSALFFCSRRATGTYLDPVATRNNTIPGVFWPLVQPSAALWHINKDVLLLKRPNNRTTANADQDWWARIFMNASLHGPRGSRSSRDDTLGITEFMQKRAQL